MHLEATATGRSLVQRSYTKCVCVSLRVIRATLTLYTYNGQVERGQLKELSSFMKVLKFKNVFRNETVESARYLPRFFVIK